MTTVAVLPAYHRGHSCAGASGLDALVQAARHAASFGRPGRPMKRFPRLPHHHAAPVVKASPSVDCMQKAFGAMSCCATRSRRTSIMHAEMAGRFPLLAGGRIPGAAGLLPHSADLDAAISTSKVTMFTSVAAGPILLPWRNQFGHPRILKILSAPAVHRQAASNLLPATQERPQVAKGAEKTTRSSSRTRPVRTCRARRSSAATLPAPREIDPRPG